MNDAPKSILVYVGLSLVGDGLMKLPFVRALRAAYPDARITWLAGKGGSVYANSLAPLVQGLLDEVIDNAGVGSHFGELFSTPLRHTPLTGQRFDLIIDTQRRVLTTLILKRIPHGEFISGAGKFMLSTRLPPQGRVKPPAMVDGLFALLSAATGHTSHTQAALHLDEKFHRGAEALLPEASGYIGMAPGAGGKWKCWPLENFIELARRIVANGKMPVVILGPGEVDWVDAFRDAVPEALLPLQSPAAESFDGSPMLTVALGSRLDAAIANDSGTGHMLAAGGAPLLSLFGPTPPEKFAPFAEPAAILQAQNFGSDEMTAIPVDAVVTALSQLTSGATRP